jgi:hypothetical protein
MLYYVGDVEGQHHHIVGVPARDLEDSDLPAVASALGYEDVDAAREHLLRSNAYSDKAPDAPEPTETRSSRRRGTED